MKIRNLLLLLALVLSVNWTWSQDRYLDQVFDEVSVEENVEYGSNYTVLFAPTQGQTVLQPLLMDIYEPAGDTVVNRPLVIYFHTGNFLPIQLNGQVTGTKSDSSAVEICTRLAKMGYVVASADYRMGWNPFAESAAERTLGLINAAYRGTQDARTCIRFFKRNMVESGNTYGVDTSKIVLFGEGTGGYITQAVSTLDEYNEIIMTTMPVGKFTADLTGDGNPDPMIIPQVNGDIYGTSVGIAPPGADPVPAGDTLCISNHEGYNSDAHLCVNLGGALGDISWMEADEVPFISFHVPLDENAPYESRILNVPSPQGPLPVVEVQGSKLAITKANELGLNDVFAEVDDETTDAAKEASAAAGHDYLNGLYPMNQSVNMFGRVDGAPWAWWEPAIWDTIPHPTAGMGSIPEDATYHDVASFSNPNMSPEKGRAYIDTIMAYYAPRAYLALGLSDSTTATIDLLTKEQVSLVIAPNPSYGQMQIQTGSDSPMQAIGILDVTGRKLLERKLNQSTFAQIDHSTIPAGLYLLEVFFEDGKVVEQVVFR